MLSTKARKPIEKAEEAKHTQEYEYKSNSYEDIGVKSEDVEDRKPNNNIVKAKDAEHREAREPIEKAEEAEPTRDTHELSLPVTMIIWRRPRMQSTEMPEKPLRKLRKLILC